MRILQGDGSVFTDNQALSAELPWLHNYLCN
jgi:hypothetical protein